MARDFELQQINNRAWVEEKVLGGVALLSGLLNKEMLLEEAGSANENSERIRVASLK